MDHLHLFTLLFVQIALKESREYLSFSYRSRTNIVLRTAVRVRTLTIIATGVHSHIGLKNSVFFGGVGGSCFGLF